MKLEWMDAVGLGLFAVLMISGCVIIHMLYFKLERMESLLSRSRQISDLNSRLRWAGYYGRIMRMSTIFACLIYPRFWVNRGLLDPADLAEFPKGLRLFVVVSFAVAVANIVAIFIYNVIKG